MATLLCAGTCVLVGLVDESGSRNDLCRVVSSHLDKGNAIQEQGGVFVGLLLSERAYSHLDVAMQAAQVCFHLNSHYDWLVRRAAGTAHDTNFLSLRYIFACNSNDSKV